MRRTAVLAVVATLVLPAFTRGNSEEFVDLLMVNRIRDEGFNNSKVMETLGQLTDVIGPRLTGSPQMKKANEWTREQLTSWGLASAHLESWGPFGRGWSLDRVAVHMLSPDSAPLIAIPKAWTPGTDGPVKGKVVRVKLESDADIEKQKGKLAGMIVFLSEPRELKPPEKALFERYDDKGLEEIVRFDPVSRRPVPPGQPADRAGAVSRIRMQRVVREFLSAEKALASVEESDRDAGMIRVQGGGSREKGSNPGVPALVMAAEHYNRVARLLDRKIEVELEIDIRAKFHDDDLMAYNTVAEIPGTDRKGEVVMVGAHMDSWHSGVGATDNAAGCAVAMEAVRILKALDVKPRRTIRIGLWSGEEEGLLGSRAYVRDHFGSRPEPDPSERELPTFLRRPAGPLTLKPDHAKLSAYFNLDNGTGRIRGIYTQQNAAAAPIFEVWFKPFADLGAAAITNRNTFGTDHLSFDAVGLPGFQFIQDQADYDTRTHHTNMDVYDRIQRLDMMQASVVMTSFLYHAAMREPMFPRKPLPKDPPPNPEAGPGRQP